MIPIGIRIAPMVCAAGAVTTPTVDVGCMGAFECVVHDSDPSSSSRVTVVE
ncbi:hypothetical protein HMPREF9597_02089 [Cutibacterium acnes HL005PA4]|nr:hypothetical protein HMPREF9597_02089 [Cutibacterium acnes HL005PA4]